MVDATIEGDSYFPSFDRAAWEKTARAVSAAFRRFPNLEDGQVAMRGERLTHRFLNSEGSWHRVGNTFYEVVLRSSMPQADGTTLSDTRRFYALRPAGLPSQEQLIASAESLAQSLATVVAAGCRGSM